jgi:hypothetical protein
MALARLTAALGLALGLAGCASGGPPSVSLHEALERAEGAARAGGPPRGGSAQTFGYQAPYTPLVIPPDVRRVWVPTHVNDEGELIQGHWVFLRLTDWQWFTAAPRQAADLAVPVQDQPLPPPWPAPGAAPATTLVPWKAVEAAPEGPPPPAPPAPPAPGSEPPPPPAPPAAPGPPPAAAAEGRR